MAAHLLLELAEETQGPLGVALARLARRAQGTPKANPARAQSPGRDFKTPPKPGKARVEISGEAWLVRLAAEEGRDIE